MDYGYQKLTFTNADFPIIIHKEVMGKSGEIIPHWHESIELLYIISGAAVVKIGAAEYCARPGDIVTVNSQQIHRITFKEEGAVYYCLTLDADFCKSNGFPVETECVLPLVSDTESRRFFDNILMENTNRRPYYKTAIKNSALALMINLYRSFPDMKAESKKSALNPSAEIARKTMGYIRSNYKEAISTHTISRQLGVSLYHLCRSFKRATDMTIVQYINITRCNHARSLLLSGNFSVGQAAEMSGFNNFSYFSKTYTLLIGCSPSETLKAAR